MNCQQNLVYAAKIAVEFHQVGKEALHKCFQSKNEKLREAAFIALEEQALNQALVEERLKRS